MFRCRFQLSAIPSIPVLWHSKRDGMAWMQGGTPGFSFFWTPGPCRKPSNCGGGFLLVHNLYTQPDEETNPSNW